MDADLGAVHGDALMPDIAMCVNEDCPMAARCYRHEARPTRLQTYGDFAPNEDGECEWFWEMGIDANTP